MLLSVTEVYSLLILFHPIFREISESGIGGFAKRLSTSIAETDGEFAGSNVVSVFTTVCGGNPLPQTPKSALKLSKYYNAFTETFLVNFDS